MKVASVVRDGERKMMNTPDQLLESCWKLADQEMMLDVAAAIVATQPELSTTPATPGGARPSLALHWAARELQIKRAS
jgi:hypothetical protein